MKLTISAEKDTTKNDGTSLAMGLSEQISDTFSTYAVVKEGSLLQKRKRDAKACDEKLFKLEKAKTQRLERYSIEQIPGIHMSFTDLSSSMASPAPTAPCIKEPLPRVKDLLVTVMQNLP